MATACYINVYNSSIDRGATVSRCPREHYEIDEEQIKVGQPLPKWWSCVGAPIVTVYDGQHLELELRGKTISIKIGEEVEIECTETNMGYGVICRDCYYVKLISTELIYKGDWQLADTILEKLAGPIGDGEVWYPNGDHFKGAFHLSYASINGPAYAADGRYEFADGSYIERAWIHTSKDKKPQWWGLHGVFRIHHPEGPDSIAMFLRGGKRYGFELFLGNKPWVNEWYANDSIVRFSAPEELFQYEVVDFEIDETSQENCSGAETIQPTNITSISMSPLPTSPYSCPMAIFWITMATMCVTSSPMMAMWRCIVPRRVCRARNTGRKANRRIIRSGDVITVPLPR